MARVQNPIIGRASGKFGGAVFATLFGQNILRTLPVEVRNPRTPAQQLQREKFARSIEAIKAMYPFVKNAFPIGSAQMSPSSYVMKSVLASTSGSAGSVAVDHETMFDQFNPDKNHSGISVSLVDQECTVYIDGSAFTDQWMQGDDVDISIVFTEDIFYVNASSLINESQEATFVFTLPENVDPSSYVVYVTNRSRTVNKPGAELASKVS